MFHYKTLEIFKSITIPSVLIYQLFQPVQFVQGIDGCYFIGIDPPDSLNDKMVCRIEDFKLTGILSGLFPVAICDG